MRQLGDYARSPVLTTSAPNTDEIGEIDHVLHTFDDGSINERVLGYSARHGSTVASIRLSVRDEPDADPAPDDWEDQMVRAALVAAGAVIQKQSDIDACGRVSLPNLQTLMALGPSDVSKPVLSHPDERSSMCTVTVSQVTVTQYLNTHDATDALDYYGRYHGLVHTADASDRAFNNVDSAKAMHGVVVAAVELRGAPESEAADHPSFAYHLQQVALAAAGATIMPSPDDPAIPLPKQRTPGQQRWRSFSPHIGEIFFLLLMVYFYWRIYVLVRLMAVGVPAVAVVNNVTDTGVTVNNNPRVKFHVTITTADGRTYQSSKSRSVSRMEAPASLIGRQFDVIVDPKHPTRFKFK
jgi:hypothetical protein